MACGFAKRSIQLLLNKEMWGKLGRNMFTKVCEKSNTIDIVDDKVYDYGETHDIAYILKLDLVDCSYRFDPDKIKDQQVIGTIYEYVQKLSQSVMMALPSIVEDTCAEDVILVYEPQTLTFYTHYNSFYRIGIIVDVISLDEYEKMKDTNVVYDSNLTPMDHSVVG